MNSMTRKQAFEQMSNLEEYKEYFKNLEDLKFEINHFLNKMGFRSLYIFDKVKREKRIVEAMRNIISARAHLDNCIHILKNNFELEDNVSIQEVSKQYGSYQAFVSYLGITNGRLDIMMAELENIENKRLNYGTSTMSFINPVSINWIESMKESLFHMMKVLIIFPLKNATEKFDNCKEEMQKKDKDGTVKIYQIVKNKDFFFYKLFLEVYHALEVEGALSRQAMLANKYSGLRTMETVSVKSPPPNIPPNASYQEVQNDYPNVREEEFLDLGGSNEYNY